MDVRPGKEAGRIDRRYWNCILFGKFAGFRIAAAEHPDEFQVVLTSERLNRLGMAMRDDARSNKAEAYRSCQPTHVFFLSLVSRTAPSPESARGTTNAGADKAEAASFR